MQKAGVQHSQLTYLVTMDATPRLEMQARLVVAMGMRQAENH